MFRKISAFVALILAVAISGYCFAQEDLRQLIPQQMSYTTATIKLGNLERDEIFSADLKFNSVVSVTLPKNGKYVTGVIGGSYVHTGDEIARFSVPDNSEAVYEAKLNYELADAQYRSSIDSAKAALDNAVTELDKKSAKATLDYITYSGKLGVDIAKKTYETLKDAGEAFAITAPCDGYVSNIAHSTNGEMYAGQNYCEIRVIDKIQLVVAIDSTVVNAAQRTALLTIGSEVTIDPIRADAPAFTGHVISNTSVIGNSSISPYAVIEFDDLSAFIEYAVKVPAAITDTKYRVTIKHVDIEGVLLCPTAAIQRENTYRYVNILSEGIPKKRYVLVGISGSEYTLIFGGLSEGDEVII